MNDDTLVKIISEYSSIYEKSLKNQIDFLKGVNSMITWLLTISGATIIFGFKDFWAQYPNWFLYTSLLFGIQILSAVLHRIYNDSHTSYLNERIDYVNLQKVFIQNEITLIRNYPQDKIYFGLYNKIVNLSYLTNIEMSGVKQMLSNLKFTKRVYTVCGVLVILLALTIYSIFLYLLTK